MRKRSVKNFKKYGKKEEKGLEEGDSYASLSSELRDTMCVFTIAIELLFMTTESSIVEKSRPLLRLKRVYWDHMVCNNRISPIMWLAMSQNNRNKQGGNKENTNNNIGTKKIYRNKQ